MEEKITRILFGKGVEGGVLKEGGVAIEGGIGGYHEVGDAGAGWRVAKAWRRRV